MTFFDDAQKKLDEAKKWVDEQGGVDGLKQKASDRADEVLNAAEGMGGKIPGDIDDQLINKAKEIKEKLAGGK